MIWLCFYLAIGFGVSIGIRYTVVHKYLEGKSKTLPDNESTPILLVGIIVTTLIWPIQFLEMILFQFLGETYEEMKKRDGNE